VSLARGSAEAGRAIAEWLNLNPAATVPETPTADRPLELSFAGFAALLAAVDAVESGRLRARLARQQEWKPMLKADVLENVYWVLDGASVPHAIADRVQPGTVWFVQTLGFARRRA